MLNKLRKMLYNPNQLGYWSEIKILLQHFPSHTKVTNVFFCHDVLGHGSHSEPLNRPQIQPKKRGLFLGENCCNFWNRHTTKVKFDSFDCLGHDNSIKPNLTCVVCLVQKLQHLIKIANSWRWRCFLSVVSLLLRQCLFFPHHIIEIAIKFDQSMLQKTAWAHLDCHEPRNRMHPIWLLLFNGLKSYGPK